MGHDTSVFSWDGIPRTRRITLPETIKEHTKYVKQQFQRHCTSGDEGPWFLPWNMGNELGEACSCRVVTVLWEFPGHGIEKGTKEKTSSFPELRRQSWEPVRGLEYIGRSTMKKTSWRILRGSLLDLSWANMCMWESSLRPRKEPFKRIGGSSAQLSHKARKSACSHQQDRKPSGSMGHWILRIGSWWWGIISPRSNSVLVLPTCMHAKSLQSCPTLWPHGL